MLELGGWTRYKLQRKLFAIGEDLWIENEKGESIFKVDGKALNIRQKFILEDQGGGELLSVEIKLTAIEPTMKIERQGQLYATVTMAVFPILPQRFTIQVEGGPTYEADGDITSHEYKVVSNGAPVAHISRKWYSLHGVYGVAVAPELDQALMLAVAVCIDEITERERDRHP